MIWIKIIKPIKIPIKKWYTKIRFKITHAALQINSVIDHGIIIRLLKANQRLKAFNLGNIISDEHNIKGNNILPNPPINNSIRL